MRNRAANARTVEATERYPSTCALDNRHHRISRDFAADPDAWATAIAPYAPNTDEAGLRELAATFAGSWSVNGGMSRTDLQYTQDWLYATGDFAGVTPVTLDQWVDFGPVDAALAVLGTVDGDAAAR